MDYSVIAYLKRLPKEKAEAVLRDWSVEEKRPPYVSDELMDILLEKVKENDQLTNNG